MTATPSAHERVVVIGAGAVGACIARELALTGREVVVVDERAGWGAGCSWGNAGYICPSHAGPWATRRELRQAVRWLGRRDSPLGMRPSPGLVPFFGRVLAAGAEDALRAGVVNRAMAVRAVELHAELAAAGLDTGFAQRGLLDVYTDEGRFADARVIAEQQTADGVTATPVDAARLAELEPALDVDAVGGVLYPGDAHCDPGRFMRAIGADAERLGVERIGGVRVTGLERRRGGVLVRSARGDLLADRVVIAAGAASSTLARRPYPWLQGGKGFSLDFAADGRALPQRPTMLQEARVAITPFADRMRAAGTMLFTGLDEAVDPRRLDGMERAAREAFPEFADVEATAPWSGLRPCTPDGLPLIGWVADRVMLATGHAMLGLALAPETAERVRLLLDGERPEHTGAMSPGRFRAGR